MTTDPNKVPIRDNAAEDHTVSQTQIDEIKQLVESGDVSLDEYKTKYKTVTGNECQLSDEQLIEAIAMTDDDDDHLFVRMANLVAAGAPAST